MSLGRRHGLFLLAFGALFAGIPLVMLFAKPYRLDEAPELLVICLVMGTAALFIGALLFSLPFVGLGGLAMAQALGLGEANVPDAVLGLVGLVFLLPGILILLYGLGVRKRGAGVRSHRRRFRAIGVDFRLYRRTPSCSGFPWF